MGISGMKRSRSEESADDNDDTFAFLDTTRPNPASPTPSAPPDDNFAISTTVFSRSNDPADEEQEQDEGRQEKEHVEVTKKESTPIPTIIEPPQNQHDDRTRAEATPGASVPPDSVASFTYENTPEYEMPVKRKRGRPAKNRSLVSFTEPGTPVSMTDPQSLVTPLALPQIMADGDENIPMEIDPAGEAKVTTTGYLAGNREYALKTFTVIGHGEKLFMLATEVARLTGYRDSYLFFLRNRSLRKVVTTQTEKEDLISQDVIPFSYRSRQISVVTARSVFLQFGHRVILHGQPIRDDYFEERARKDHHIEMKVPETQNLRHQAALAAANAAMNATNTHNAHLPVPAPVAVVSSSPHSDIPRPREFPLPKASRPPIFGAPWTDDRYQPLSASLMLEKAQAAMRYNSLVTGERRNRMNMWKEYWIPASARKTEEMHLDNEEPASSSSGPQSMWQGQFHA